jgi:hypothetical protein
LDFDLTGFSASELKSPLKKIGTSLGTVPTVPAGLIEPQGQPGWQLGVKYFTVYLWNEGSALIGFPSFWGKLNITQNLALGGFLGSAVRWGDNLQTAGSFLAASWGAPGQGYGVTIAQAKLNGPDDFSQSVVQLQLTKEFSLALGQLFLIYDAQYQRFRVQITDADKLGQNYRKTINLKLNALRVAFYRQISDHFATGAELQFSEQAFSPVFGIIYKL